MQMPAIAFGTGSKWKGQVRRCMPSMRANGSEGATVYQDVTDYVLQALETGFSHIDSAQCMSLSQSMCQDYHQTYSPLRVVYRTEDSVGRALHESAIDRSELFITTKYSGLTTIPEAIQESLTNVRESRLCYVCAY